MRHSLAHIMASAIIELWPHAKFGVGPVIDDGFYYDIDLGDLKLSESDFSKIEAKMKDIIKQDQTFEHFELPIDQALEWSITNKQPYKQELLNDLKRSGTTMAKDLDITELGIESSTESVIDKVSFYKNGDFVDLCRGPHLESTGKAGPFRLMKIAGAYWRGKESNPQMQRIYGVAFNQSRELEDYLERLEQAKLRDHRKIGRDMDLYTVSNLVGAGLPLFTPRGSVLRDTLSNYSNQLRQRYGFQKVWSPHITKKALYETSGHWAKFGDELLLVTSQETNDEFAMKPMNCPHHTQIFASSPKSYKDLPVRYLETTTVYRDEKTGELGGLSRVRSITQDDSHIFCASEQIGSEINNLLVSAKELYGSLDMKLRIRLSYRDESDKYLGDIELWRSAQEQLKTAVQSNDLEFFEQDGEAAFYGPKIDFMATDAIGREHQVATIQLDFVQPQRFGLNYTKNDGSLEAPVMIHCALLGSIERFMSVFIEHTAGWFPFWCAPEQIRILTINDTVSDYVYEISEVLSSLVLMTPLKYNEIRFTTDIRNESIGKKIKDAVFFKIPILIIVGPRDSQSKTLSIRLKNEEKTIKIEELRDFLLNLDENR